VKAISLATPLEKRRECQLIRIEGKEEKEEGLGSQREKVKVGQLPSNNFCESLKCSQVCDYRHLGFQNGKGGILCTETNVTSCRQIYSSSGQSQQNRHRGTGGER
jgi:hypothetical protein